MSDPSVLLKLLASPFSATTRLSVSLSLLNFGFTPSRSHSHVRSSCFHSKPALSSLPEPPSTTEVIASEKLDLFSTESQAAQEIDESLHRLRQSQFVRQPSFPSTYDQIRGDHALSSWQNYPTKVTASDLPKFKAEKEDDIEIWIKQVPAIFEANHCNNSRW